MDRISSYDNFFTKDEIDYFMENIDVLSAKDKIDQKPSGSVYFSIDLPIKIKNKLTSLLGADLSKVSKIPMRWIKGDTQPHIDTGVRKFENTFLAYLTNSEGQLVIEDNEFSITQGSAYVFNEGLSHKTVGTGIEPRLLLGPMSEEGFAVGNLQISANGGTTTVYIFEDSGLKYRYNDGIPEDLNSPPFQVTNTNPNPSLNPLKIIFETDITLTNTGQYFQCSTEGIQFGNESLNEDGSRPTITVTASGYNGLVFNGFAGGAESNGKNNIRIYNLNINGTGGSLAEGAGWFGQSYFGKGATDNYIINCRSDGPIGNSCGGIAGQYSGSDPGAELTIIGCSSSGDLTGYLAGGIVGDNVGYNNGNVNCISCWSEGDITNNILSDGCGGIIGANCVSATITNCYSEGNINGNNSGGIIGPNAGISSALISNCYSRGNISGDNAGGICGSFGLGTFSVTITNCYTTGNVTTSAQCGGICGFLNGPTITLTITNCYASGTTNSSTGYIIGGIVQVNNSPPYLLTNNYSEAGSGGTPGAWSDAHANTALLGTPASGYSSTSVWQTISGTGTQPYELFNMGYNPYSTTNISSIPNLIKTSSATVILGNSTSSAIKISGPYYTFLEDYTTLYQINIDNATGVISTTLSTPPNIYTLYIYNTGSYNITTFQLTVTSGGGEGGVTTKAEISCCAIPLDLKNADYRTRYEIKDGNIILANLNSTPTTNIGKPKSYSELLAIKMAKAAKNR